MSYIKTQLRKLLNIVDELEEKYKKDKRKFTLDGHLLGSIGEIYASEKYDLILAKSSQKGFDATDENDLEVQIKVTQSNKVGLRNEPQKLLVLKWDKETLDFNEIYYGEGKKAWDISNKKNSSGQRFITLNKLLDLKSNA